METSRRTKVHPMIVVAAASVALVSLVGAASIAGLLPNSQATTIPGNAPAPVAAVSAPAKEIAPEPAPEPRRVVEHKAPTHRTYVPASRVTPEVAQASVAAPAPAPSQAPAPTPAPAPQNSALGIGIGAVVGGLIGNQVGGGNGRKLATIAGAIGGGYVGNEIAKRNQQQQPQPQQ